MKTLIDLWNDDGGASAAEYALILAIVGSGIALAAYSLGTSIKGAMTGASGCIAQVGGTTAPNC